MKFINGFWITTRPLILITESDISESDVSEADRFIEIGIDYYWMKGWVGDIHKPCGHCWGRAGGFAKCPYY